MRCRRRLLYLSIAENCVAHLRALLWRALVPARLSQIRMLADPQAAFTKAIGLDIALPPLGGVRSKRYSMIIENGVVKAINVEVRRSRHVWCPALTYQRCRSPTTPASRARCRTRCSPSSERALCAGRVGVFPGAGACAA